MFYLLRHGEKENKFGDPPLTPAGQSQAKAAAKFFKDKNIKLIYTSPMKRTLETAEIVSSELSLPIATDERLIERFNWGDVEGETFEDFLKEWVKTDANRDYISNRGYSARSRGEDINSLLKEVEEQKIEGDVLFVTHGGLINDLLRNNHPDEALPMTNVPWSPHKYIDILECSVTSVTIEGDQLVLQSIGDVTHLSEVK